MNGVLSGALTKGEPSAIFIFQTLTQSSCSWHAPFARNVGQVSRRWVLPPRQACRRQFHQPLRAANLSHERQANASQAQVRFHCKSFPIEAVASKWHSASYQGGPSNPHSHSTPLVCGCVRSASTSSGSKQGQTPESASFKLCLWQSFFYWDTQHSNKKATLE